MEQRPHQLRVIEIGDEPEAWEAAGFAVVNGAVTIGTTRLELIGGIERGITRVTADDVAAPIDGMPFAPAKTGDADRARPASAGHANRVIAIDHVVALSTDVDRTITALEAADVDLRRERHFGEGADAKRQAFYWLGDVILELAGPATANGDGPAQLWGLALACDDLDAAKTALDDRLSDPRAAVQPGRRIATLRTKELGISIPVALMSPHSAG